MDGQPSGKIRTESTGPDANEDAMNVPGVKEAAATIALDK